jgi:hypothetical protein
VQVAMLCSRTVHISMGSIASSTSVSVDPFQPVLSTVPIIIPISNWIQCTYPGVLTQFLNLVDHPWSEYPAILRHGESPVQ